MNSKAQELIEMINRAIAPERMSARDALQVVETIIDDLQGTADGLRADLGDEDDGA